MSRHITIHTAGMRRQLRRIQQTTLIGTGALLLCGPVLFTTTETGWWSLALRGVFAGYLGRNVLRVLWAHRVSKQLRLEEQFVRYSPAVEHVRTCLHRYDHLWTSSSTLKGLQALFKQPVEFSALEEEQHAHIRRSYSRSFATLFPSWIPLDLLWFTVLLLLWLWSVPESLLRVAASPVLVGAVLLLVVLVAEVIRFVLCFDLRAGLNQLVTLLSDWTLTSPFDELLRAGNTKRYRHHPLYRSTPVVLPSPGP